MSSVRRAALSAAILSISCCTAAFWAPSVLFGEGATLTTLHTDVIAFVAKTQLVIGFLIFATSNELTPLSVAKACGLGLGHLAGAALAYHVLFVLFGAPLLDQVEDTALFSFSVAVLGAFPAGCCYGKRTDKAQNVLLHFDPTTPMDWVVMTSFLSPLVGAWLGAFAIPLDWDRPWQPWPISSAYMAYASYSLALMACAVGLWFLWGPQKVKSG